MIVIRFPEAADEKRANVALIVLQAASSEPPGVKPPALLLFEVVVPEGVDLSPITRRGIDPI